MLWHFVYIGTYVHIDKLFSISLEFHGKVNEVINILKLEAIFVHLVGTLSWLDEIFL